MITLGIVLVLVLSERIFRRRSRRWSDGISGGEETAWRLHGLRALVAQLLALMPRCSRWEHPCSGPSAILINWEPASTKTCSNLCGRSLILGISSAVLAVGLALVLAIAQTLEPGALAPEHHISSRHGLCHSRHGSGPGSVTHRCPLANGSGRVAALGLQRPFSGGRQRGTRFRPRTHRSSLDEAATGLGSRWHQVLQSVHLPLLRGPVTVGLLLVFVDTVKELPLTFALRPFDFDTLSVRVYQYASDERLAEAMLPAIMILLLGLVAAMALVPTLKRPERNAEPNGSE